MWYPVINLVFIGESYIFVICESIDSHMTKNAEKPCFDAISIVSHYPLFVHMKSLDTIWVILYYCPAFKIYLLLRLSYIRTSGSV